MTEPVTSSNWGFSGERHLDRLLGWPSYMDDQVLLPPSRPPRAPGQEPSARLTLDAYQRMRRELDQLKSEGRSIVSERLARAREHGDFRENADYDAAKKDKG